MKMKMCSLLVALVVPIAYAQQEKPQVQIPQPGVPQIMTLEGSYVRAAYNNEAYAILGYRVANQSIGEEWMLLDFGTTLRDGVPDYTLKPEAISLTTPDGTKVPLATIQEYRGGNLQALENRARVVRDSINYFPPSAHRACRIGFFAPLDQKATVWSEVELDPTRACTGRLYFKIPGGIKYGQHWLDVQYAKSLVRVPFRILTKDEEKLLSKNFKDIKKQVDEAFKPKKKTTTENR